MTYIDPASYIQNTPAEVVAEYDPFVGTALSSGRHRAFCRIWIGDFDITSGAAYEVTDNLFPHLISVHVLDSIDSMTVDVELDDRYGTLPIPPLWTPMVVVLGWNNGDSGEVAWVNIVDIEHGCNRNSGRRMWIHATGENFYTAGKENQQDSIGEGAPAGQNEGPQISIVEAINRFAAAAGHTAVVNPQVNSITNDHWSIENESYLNWSSKMAEQFGLLFRVIKGTQSEWTKPGQRADQADGLIKAVWGDNMIGWRLHPAASRPAWNESRQQFFDTRKAWWRGISTSVASLVGASQAAYQGAGPAANGGVADNQANGSGDMISLSDTVGRVVINGEPGAHGGYHLLIAGARPGVDGIWWMKEVEHLYSRQGGYVTWCDVWYPESLSAGQLQQLGVPPNIYQQVTANFAQAYSVNSNTLTDYMNQLEQAYGASSP